LEVAASTGQLVWVKVPQEDWQVLEADDRWNSYFEWFGGEPWGGHSAEMVMLPAEMEPHGDQLKTELLQLDLPSSRISVWASQIDEDPCTLAFVSQAVIEDIREGYKPFVKKEVLKRYKDLGSEDMLALSVFFEPQ
jgi:hypothetical protein